MVRTLAAAMILTTSLLTLPAFADPSIPAPAATGASVALARGDQDANPADSSTPDIDRLDLQYAKGLFVDTGKILVSPLHWEPKDWLKAGLVLGVASSLLLVDEKVKDFAQSHQSPVASKFATVGNDLGNGLYTLPPVGAFYLYGYLADDHKARKTALLAVESFAISGVMVSGLKVLAQRHRPNTGDGPNSWDGPHLSLSNLSFCSGHTASSFSIATIFADQYKDNPYVAPVAYSLATLTGLSRIYSNAHWSSDAFFGAALGYFVSKAVLHYHQDDKDKLANRLMIMPAVSKEMTGLSMQYQF
jgi:membrane-associated phospholipid phosphatase